MLGLNEVVMSLPREIVPPSPDQFRDGARREFAFLEHEYGFQEQPIPANIPFSNPCAVWFATPTTRVVIEGINWGMNARVAVGSVHREGRFENYDLGDLVAIRENIAAVNGDTAPPPSGQLEQLIYYATLLRHLADDVLRGDHSAFPALAARVEARRAEFLRRDPND
jgi:hypothetical protein